VIRVVVIINVATLPTIGPPIPNFSTNMILIIKLTILDMVWRIFRLFKNPRLLIILAIVPSTVIIGKIKINFPHTAYSRNSSPTQYSKKSSRIIIANTADGMDKKDLIIIL